jgi:hypothetical protein
MDNKSTRVILNNINMNNVMVYGFSLLAKKYDCYTSHKIRQLESKA